MATASVLVVPKEKKINNNEGIRRKIKYK